MVAADEKNSLDVALGHFNNFGKYHSAIGTIVFITFITNSMYCLNYLFVTDAVGYRCIELADQCIAPNLTSEPENWKAVCSHNVETCGARNITLKCIKWEYDDPTSFMAEFQLACQEWKTTLLGTVHSFGYMVGLLIVGPLADRIGRKNTTIIIGVLGSIFGIARSFTSIFWLYLVFEFLEASIGDTCSPMFMIAVEIVSTKNRPLFYSLVSLGYPIGGALLSLIAWLSPNWRIYLRILYAPSLLMLSYKYFLDESPRWLLSKGRNKEAVVILNRAAKLNKIQNVKTVIEKISDEVYETKTVRLSELLKYNFKSRVILLRFFICVFWWVTCTFTSYGMSVRSVTLGGNKYLNYFFTSMIEAPATLTVGYLMKTFDRKRSLFGAFMFEALFCIAQPFMPTSYLWLSTAMFMAGKFMSCICFTVVYVYTSELFPTYTRNSMHALCSSLGRVGSIVAQQTPLLLVIWSGLPSMLFGLVALIAGLLTLLVPNTSEDTLPDTVEQAEKVGVISEKTINVNDFDVTERHYK